MDDQRFDNVARAMASGASRRRALRLAGAGVAAALLTVAGRVGGGEAGAEAIFTNCVNYGAQGGPAIVDVQPGEQVLIRKPCGACPGDRVCAALLNPAEELVCRCLKL